MKKQLAWLGAAVLALACTQALADRLEDIQKKGVLKVASFDSNPPFGFVDAKSKKIEGLDVDFAQALADKLKVKLEVSPSGTALLACGGDGGF